MRTTPEIFDFVLRDEEKQIDAAGSALSGEFSTDPVSRENADE
jgi:hypothetical protein